jgi:HB1, ASXL, restriction endonuclease HTH domain
MAPKKTKQKQIPSAKSKQAAKVKQAAKTKPAATARSPQPPAEKNDKKLSALKAAAKVLGETGQAMATKELIEAMAAKGYWTSPAGKTPAATLYAAILLEIKNKGAEARFCKTERGKFALAQSR